MKLKIPSALKKVVKKGADEIKKTEVGGKLNECALMCSKKVSDSKVSDAGGTMKKCIEKCIKDF
jgi:hypothetical protein